VGSKRLEITGGTNAYASARGQIAEEDALRTLEIVL
jgi:hypothetical protein